MIERSGLLPVGKVLKTHGVNGEMSMAFDIPEFIDALQQGDCLVMEIDGIPTPFFVDSVRPRGSESLLVKFDGIDSQEEAAQYVGFALYADKANIPEITVDEDGEEGFYATQLIGFNAIIDGQDEPFGQISDIDDTTENALFVIVTEDGETMLVPIADELIAYIDPDKKEIGFDLPEGFFEI